MLTKIQKWGNSQGFRIPKSVLENVHLIIGDNVDIQVDNGKIVLIPTNKIRNRFNINELVSSKIDKDGELEWGKVVGNEAW